MNIFSRKATAAADTGVSRFPAPPERAPRAAVESPLAIDRSDIDAAFDQALATAFDNIDAFARTQRLSEDEENQCRAMARAKLEAWRDHQIFLRKDNRDGR